MNINNSNFKEKNDGTNISDAKNRIINYLQMRIAEIGNSIEGERPDENGDYSSGYYEGKDLRDALNEFIRIVISEEKNETSFDSVESFVKSVCKKIQNFPQGTYGQLFDFIKETFGIEIAPLSGPTIFYTAWLNHYSQYYDVKKEELEKIMPWSEFQKYEQSNDTAARIRFIMNHFGETE